MDLPSGLMTPGEVGYFVDCTVRDTKEKEQGEVYSFDDEAASNMKTSGRLFKRRLDMFDGKVSFTVGWLCIALSRDQADIIMWAWSMAALNKKLGREVSFQDFVDAFPNGIPNRKSRADLWKSQMIGLDCWFNHPEDITDGY